MGAASATVGAGSHDAVTGVVVILVGILTASLAEADPCTGHSSSGGRFAICFDPGNRLSLTAGSDGIGMRVSLRHEMHFDDEPDLVWRLEHQLVDGAHATLEDRLSATLYRGVFIRHARDGHIVIPLGTPKKVFMPFDVGAHVEVGTLAWTPDSLARVGIVKTAALFDLARSRSFRRRLAIGPVARWSVDLMRSPRTFGDHQVGPFTSGLATLRWEAQDGRLIGDLQAEAGIVWHTNAGWQPETRAEATVERIMLAINDRPIALVVGVRYDSETDEALARVGARIVIAQRRDPRVANH